MTDNPSAKQHQRLAAMSVQDIEPPSPSTTIQNWMVGITEDSMYLLLPTWGSPSRQRHLRGLFYNQHNTLVTGALSNIITRVDQTPWKMIGQPKDHTQHYHHLLQESNQGNGFSDFISKIVQDFLTLDLGAFIEIVGPGASDQPLVGPPLALNSLDGARCYVTGNPEWPVYYMSHRSGGLHKMHHTRVARLVDLPSPDPEMKGLGLSALSRAAAVVHAELLLVRHEIGELDDTPASGILSFAGLSEKQLVKALQKYNEDQDIEALPVLRNLLQITSMDPRNPVKVEFTPFSSIPGKADSETIIRNHVNMLSAAIGEDPQEIFPLASVAMGSSAQSKILHAKGKSKIYGKILTLLERTFNTKILAPGLELKFGPRDTEQSREEAEISQLWAGITVNLLNNRIFSTAAMAQQFLANTVETFSEFLLDEQGFLRFTDDDQSIGQTDPQPIPTEEVSPQFVYSDTDPDREKAIKSRQSVRSLFELDMEDLLTRVDSMDRRRFGIVLRGMISKYGRQNYYEGMMAGGVLPLDIAPEEQREISDLIKEQSIYVSRLGQRLFRSKRQPSEIALSMKPAMWFNKSIEPFYFAGLKRADQNGYYIWNLGRTEKHCKDCSYYNTQVHRFRDWEKSATLPRSDRLACTGQFCDCSLTRVDGPARGRLRAPVGPS